MATIGTDIHYARQLLIEGKVVAIPTETVYGLAANALNTAAVATIFEVKNRPTFDPLIVHVSGVNQLDTYAQQIPDAAYQLAKQFWPGPLTLLLKKHVIVPDLVTSGLDTVGLRCPNHELTHALLESLPFPLAAPSANPFGYVSPTTAKHVNDQLGDKIDYILDGGACTVGIESTIVEVQSSSLVVHRLGGLSVEALQSVVGAIDIRTQSTSNPLAPGQLESHYAPNKKVIVGDIPELLQTHPAHCTGVLSFSNDYHTPYQIILSPSGSMKEAAQQLFASLRALDQMPVKTILVELAPEHDLGRAINDRLRRAAH